MTSEDLPALGHLMRAYLHQDWMHEYADEKAAIDDYMRGADDLVARLPGEITETLDSHPSDDSLTERLQGLGADYLPTGTDGTVRSWLVEVRQRTERYLASP